MSHAAMLWRQKKTEEKAEYQLLADAAERMTVAKLDAAGLRSYVRNQLVAVQSSVCVTFVSCFFFNFNCIRT